MADIYDLKALILESLTAKESQAEQVQSRMTSLVKAFTDLASNITSWLAPIKNDQYRSEPLASVTATDFMVSLLGPGTKPLGFQARKIDICLGAEKIFIIPETTSEFGEPQYARIEGLNDNYRLSHLGGWVLQRQLSKIVIDEPEFEDVGVFDQTLFVNLLIDKMQRATS